VRAVIDDFPMEVTLALASPAEAGLEDPVTEVQSGRVVERHGTRYHNVALNSTHYCVYEQTGTKGWFLYNARIGDHPSFSIARAAQLIPRSLHLHHPSEILE
jgi:hypothetical protein